MQRKENNKVTCRRKKCPISFSDSKECGYMMKVKPKQRTQSVLWKREEIGQGDVSVGKSACNQA